MEVSLRKYANIRGVSLAAVQKAVKTGRIRLESSGKINVEKANRDWRENTNPMQAKPVDVQDVSISVTDAPLKGTRGATYNQARAANEFYRAMFMKERLKKFKSEVVDRQKVNNHVFRLARATRDLIAGFPSRRAAVIAAKLKADEHETLVVLEDEFRDLLSEIGDFGKPL